MQATSSYERKRQEILSAALDMFSTRGFDGTTLEAVADALGYTKPALYYYFKNKEELFSSLILDALKQAYVQIESICAHDEPASEKLRDLIHVYLDEHFQHRGYFSITHMLKGFKDKMLPGPELEEIERLSERIPEAIVGMIAQGVAAGEFRAEDPKVLGGLVLGMLSGVLIHIDMPALSGIDRDRLTSSLDEIIVKGISR